MLMRFGRLSRDEAIGGRFRAAGMVLMPLSLCAGAWVLRVMAAARRPADGLAVAESISDQR